ncbi:MAG: YcxB family protein [Bacteroidota bacterium]|jgi:hypothetical protein
MEFSGQLTKEDMVNGFRLFDWQKRNLIMLAMQLSVIIIAAILTLIFSNIPRTTIYLFCGAIAFLYLYRHLSHRASVDTILAKQDTLYLPFSSRIDEVGFSTNSEKESSIRHWPDFVGWLENERYFILIERIGFRVIPKRIIDRSEQTNELRNLLQKHIGNAA